MQVVGEIAYIACTLNQPTSEKRPRSTFQIESQPHHLNWYSMFTTIVVVQQVLN